MYAVAADGKVLRKYGDPSTEGAGEGQLNSPSCLLKSKYRSVLVADWDNNRIIIISSSMAKAVKMPCAIENPSSIFLDESRGRLYVGENNTGRVLVFDYVFNPGR